MFTHISAGQCSAFMFFWMLLRSRSMPDACRRLRSLATVFRSFVASWLACFAEIGWVVTMQMWSARDRYIQACVFWFLIFQQLRRFFIASSWAVDGSAGTALGCSRPDFSAKAVSRWRRFAVMGRYCCLAMCCNGSQGCWSCLVFGFSFMAEGLHYVRGLAW